MVTCFKSLVNFVKETVKVVISVLNIKSFLASKGEKRIFRFKMNRLFGRGKPKEPPPNLTDCISNVSLENFINMSA